MKQKQANLSPNKKQKKVQIQDIDLQQVFTFTTQSRDEPDEVMSITLRERAESVTSPLSEVHFHTEEEEYEQALRMPKNKLNYFFNSMFFLSLAQDFKDQQQQSLSIANLFFVLMQEFTTSNFFFLPYAFLQGGFIWSNIFLIVSILISIFTMLTLIDLRDKTGLNVRELSYKNWGNYGVFLADICMFFIHFTDLYQYIMACGKIISEIFLFFDIILPFFIHTILLIMTMWPIIFLRQYTNNNTIVQFSLFCMMTGFAITLFYDSSYISLGLASRNYSYFKSIDALASFMQIYTSLEESVVVYEIHIRSFTHQQNKQFRHNVWIVHAMIFSIFAMIGNLTFLAFGPKTKQNIVDQFSNTDFVIFISKVLYLCAAIPAYAHLFQPLEMILKDILGFFDKTKRLGEMKLDYLSIDELKIDYKVFPKLQFYWILHTTNINLDLANQMIQDNSDPPTIRKNREYLYAYFALILSFMSIWFGLATDNYTVMTFNILQTIFKTPISLIIPCILALKYCSMSKLSKYINVIIIGLGILLLIMPLHFIQIDNSIQY